MLGRNGASVLYDDFLPKVPNAKVISNPYLTGILWEYAHRTYPKDPCSVEAIRDDLVPELRRSWREIDFVILPEANIPEEFLGKDGNYVYNTNETLFIPSPATGIIVGELQRNKVGLYCVMPETNNRSVGYERINPLHGLYPPPLGIEFARLAAGVEYARRFKPAAFYEAFAEALRSRVEAYKASHTVIPVSMAR